MKKPLPHNEDIQFRLLSLLAGDPTISQRALAKQLGLSLGGAHYCVQALIARGAVKVGNFKRSEHKLAYAYLLTPKGLVEKIQLTAGFLQRRMQEYEALKLEIASLQTAVFDEARDTLENGH